MKRELAAALTATTILSGMVGHVNAQTRYVTLLVGMGYRNYNSKREYEKKTITYDKYGLLKSEIYKPTRSSPYGSRYVYDSHHHIRKSIEYNDDGINTYKTNKDGMVIHSKGTDYTYNKNNQIIKEKEKGKTRYLYKYNKKGQLIAEGTPKDLKKNKGFYYQYNKYGYMSRATYNYSKTERYDFIYKYKYTKDHRVKQRKNNLGEIWTYRYKKVKINTKYLKQVRYQQDALTLKNRYTMPYIIIVGA